MIPFYNYVILNDVSDYYEVAFSELKTLDYACYIDKSELGIFQILNRIHISKKVNYCFNLPLKKIWNRFLIKLNFENKKPICFVIISGSKWLSLCKYAKFDSFLKRNYPDSKLVLYFTDLVEKTYFLYDDNKLDMNYVARVFDLVLSYDKGDCEKYNLIYYPTPYSIPKVEDNDSIFPCDIYFLGKAKERLGKIISAYDQLEHQGLVCDFYIYGVEQKQQVKRNNIHYINYLMPYQENLQRIKKSKAVLEIMQEGASGYTFRLWEALMMKKYLITDNSLIHMEIDKYQDSVVLLDDIFVHGFRDKILNPVSVNPSLVSSRSPSRLLKYIDDKLR